MCRRTGGGCASVQTLGLQCVVYGVGRWYKAGLPVFGKGSYAGGTVNYDAQSLNAVFGAGLGSTPTDRARASARKFVRSQLQLAFFEKGALGHILTALEALEIFGWKALSKVASEGGFPLAASHDEPAVTLRSRRLELGLTREQVARICQLPTDSVVDAESIGVVSPIRVLERIAQSLALDERTIGQIPGGLGDKLLGVRLRETAQAQDAVRFSARDVLELAEAAWVIGRQVTLDESVQGSRALLLRFQPSNDYRYRAYDRGEELAAATRSLLGLSPIEPIKSLKSLAEETLRIPVVQQALSDHFAGATVANGAARGVVLNERGMNENVWVRRMTLAHEIGHLLWDPSDRLNHLKVHSYSDVEGRSQTRDIVEVRANAFAVNFLAPREGVREIMRRNSEPVTKVAQVMTTFGISATAAKYHVKNVAHIEVDVPARDLPTASVDWIARENMILDIFRPESTPFSRRGKFSWHVVNAVRLNRISTDTAALYLRCTSDEVERHSDFIINALTP